jgi:hypothetical protein
MLKDVDVIEDNLALLALEQVDPEVLALEDADRVEPVGPVHVPIAAEPDIDDDDAPMSGLGVVDRVLEAPSGAEVIAPAALGDDHLGGGSPQSSISTSSSSDSDSDNELREDEPMPALAGGGPMSYKVSVDPMIISHIHGLPIKDDVYISKTGKHEPYHRIGVYCSHRFTCHQVHGKSNSCHKWRNLSARHTARYGRVESIGFLGAWIAMATTFEGKRSHVAFAPSDKQVDEWLLIQGYIAPSV